MHPVLVDLGGFQLHSFGLMMALAWLAAGVYLDRFGRPAGLTGDFVSGFLVWVLVGALIGARLLFLAVEYPSWTDDALSAVFSRSGFVFYGGFFGGVVGATLFLRRHRIPVLAVGDAVAPALALGLAIGRIGCFLAGDDYGKPASVPWAVTFTDPDSQAPLGVPLHPAQLYLSANAFALFGILHLWSRRRRFPGQILAGFLMLYAATRFGWEFFRGDPRGFWGPLSTSQWISALVFPSGLWLYFRWKGRSHNTTPSGSLA